MPCCIGPHLSINKTLRKTLETLPEGCDCFQSFLGAPIQYRIKKLDETDIQYAQECLHQRDMKMYVHAPYIINLANPEKADVGRSSLQAYLDTTSKISTTHTGIVLHIGANGTIANVADQLNSMDISAPLFLENCAGEGSKLGKNMDELNKLLEAIDSHRVGLCIDTCHAHSAGMTDFRSSSSIVQLFDELPDDRRVIFHLNDSKVAYEAKVDRHMPVGYGTIWDSGFDSLETFASLAKKSEYDIILETPTTTLEEITWLRELD